MAEKVQMLDACRDALRIPADVTDYDDEIADLIDAARAAMRAGGVSVDKSQDDSDGTVRLAIKVFCKANFGMDNPDADRYMHTFDELVTLMHGASDYGGA
ncbi:MAG: head-tail connector protein [Coriobacteriaceae bacterium]|nr:head-tail connector protein [Coriobacteriaceae bacterium]